MEDKKIIELFFNKDEEALAQVVHKYQKYCFSIAHNILYDTQDVMEVLNDTYLSLWNSIPPTCPNNLRTYIGKIARNKALDCYRKHKTKKKEVSFDELEECIPDSLLKEDCNQILLSNAINEFLATLNKSDRDIFVCRYWYFDSIKDICKRYFYSESKVKMSLKRNRDKLKEYLKKEGFIHE